MALAEIDTRPRFRLSEGELGHHGLVPEDVKDPGDLQVLEHLNLVADLLDRPDSGQSIEHVHALGDMLLATGVHRDRIPGIDRGTPYHVLYKPTEQVYRAVTALPISKQEERSQIVNSAIGFEVDKLHVSAPGYLGSRLATVPWQQRLLQQQDSSRIASIGISWKGGEGTTLPFRNGQDPFTLDVGVEQVHRTMLGVGKNLGIDKDDWISMLRAFWGHSYGALLGFRHLLRHGREFPHMRYGLITPVIMGAKRDKSEWPEWLKEAEKPDFDRTQAQLDEMLLDQHVYILDKSPLGQVVRMIGSMKSETAHDILLNLGEYTPIIDGILRYFIGSNGLGSQAILPVYKQSLHNYWSNIRDTRLLDEAPYIAGDETIALLPKRDINALAVVVGGIRDKGEGDTVLASPHMHKFVAALRQLVGIEPKLILDENSSHHPRAEAIDRLVKFSFAY